MAPLEMNQMDKAGLLDSMTNEELVETCRRLQRSCEDMTLLMTEFEQEQEMLLREQDRMHSRVEKVTLQVESDKRQEDRGMIWSFINQVDNKLEISKIFAAQAQRQAAKRRDRTWSAFRPGNRLQAIPGAADIEDFGPFSDANVQKSWGCDVTLGALRQAQVKAADVLALKRWVCDALCAESVAEADTVDMWMQKAQLMADLSLADGKSHWHQDEGVDTMKPVHNTSSRTPSGMPGIAPIKEASSEAEMGHSESEDMGHMEELPSERQPANSVQSRNSEAEGRRGSLANIQKQLTGWVADIADASMAAAANLNMSGPGAEEDVKVDSLVVVLARASTDQKWGLGWVKEHFNTSKQRIITQCVKDTVAGTYNAEQEDKGHQERCIQPGDHLVSANGKTDPAEITKELSGREVVLEFNRLIRAPAPAAIAATVQGDVAPGSEPGRPGAEAVAPRRPKAKPKASFSTAFSAYLGAQGVAPPTPSAKASSAAVAVASDAPSTPSPSKATSAASAAELPADEVSDRVPAIAVAEEPTEESAAPSRPPREAPYGVVVQVLSLTAGSLRLSWSFDWASAPAEISEKAGSFRAFEVLTCPTSEGEEQEAGQARRWICSKSMLKVELPTGRRYSLKVRAVVNDTQAADTSAPGGEPASSSSPATSSAWSWLVGGESAGPKPLWVSEPSEVASADLRSPLSSSASPTKQEVAAAMPAARKGVPSPAASESSSPAKPGPKKRGALGASLGSFLAQPQRTTSAASVARTTSNASVMSGQAAAPDTASASSSQPATSSVATADREFENPLATSAPRVVSASYQSAASEKREIAERLRMRRGGPLYALDPLVAGVGRSNSIDEDDSLQQLASALRSLQRNTSDRLKSDTVEESIGDEGHHCLKQRLDSASPLRPAHKKSHPDAEPSELLAAVPPMPSAEPLPEEVHAVGGEALDQPQAAGPGPAADRQRFFRLRVQLDDGKAETVEFSPDDDTLAIMREFTVQNHLKALFADALHERSELMVRSDRHEDSVDIIDLL